MKPVGMFKWDGEVFGWMPTTDRDPESVFQGYTDVYDERDFLVARALTPRLAVDLARFWLDSVRDDINDEINFILSNGEDL